MPEENTALGHARNRWHGRIDQALAARPQFIGPHPDRLHRRVNLGHILLP
jgi:hypothetical protein